MKKLIAAICFMALAAPGAFAQEKGKSAETKAASAAEKKAEKASEKKTENVVEKKTENVAEKKTEKTAEKTKKAPSEAQKKQQQRMKDCNKQAGEKKLKGDERKKFMSTCLKG